MRMKTSRAGTQHANIIHTGNVWCSPKGLISQPLLAGLDTIRPLGTTSFCIEKSYRVIVHVLSTETRHKRICFFKSVLKQ